MTNSVLRMRNDAIHAAIKSIRAAVAPLRGELGAMARNTQAEVVLSIVHTRDVKGDARKVVHEAETHEARITLYELLFGKKPLGETFTDFVVDAFREVADAIPLHVYARIVTDPQAEEERIARYA